MAVGADRLVAVGLEEVFEELVAGFAHEIAIVGTGGVFYASDELVMHIVGRDAVAVFVDKTGDERAELFLDASKIFSHKAPHFFDESGVVAGVLELGRGDIGNGVEHKPASGFVFFGVVFGKASGVAHNPTGKRGVSGEVGVDGAEKFDDDTVGVVIVAEIAG